MYALPALTHTAAEVVRAQFEPGEEAEPAREPGQVHRLRAALAAALERAARAAAPRPTLAEWRG
jgi:hypothetical protein